MTTYYVTFFSPEFVECKRGRRRQWKSSVLNLGEVIAGHSLSLSEVKFVGRTKVGMCL